MGIAKRIRKWTAARFRRLDLLALLSSIFAAILVTLIALAVVLFAPFSSANRAVAIGDVFGGGVFLIGTITLVLGVIPYWAASARPELNTSLTFQSLEDESLISEKAFPRDPSDRAFTGPLPASVRDRGDLVALEPAQLWLRVSNSGRAPANHVEVVLFLEGIYFNPSPALEAGSPWRFFRRETGSQIQWRGGAERPVRPGDIPRVSSVQLSGMWADLTHTGFVQIVTFADELRPYRSAFEINPASKPDEGDDGPTSPDH